MARFIITTFIAITAFSLTGVSAGDASRRVGTEGSEPAVEKAAPQPTSVVIEPPLTETSPEAPMVTWARTRFAEAGLELPEVEIVVHESTMDCDGHVGYYYAATARLELCRLDEKTVLHELAHAWANHNLSDETRVGFAELRGLGAWNDHGDAWEHRATEHAAETITWALMERETTVRWVDDDAETRRLLTIDQSSPAELVEAYRYLTGSKVPFERPVERPDTTSPELARFGK